jgi:hypothetical protein
MLTSGVKNMGEEKDTSLNVQEKPLKEFWNYLANFDNHL